MKIIKNLSIMIFLFTISYSVNKLMGMEPLRLSDNSFDMSGPSQLLQSIKILQEKSHNLEDIAQALKECLKNKNQSLNVITDKPSTENGFSEHRNILCFLDTTCNADTVSIILSSFGSEQDACIFILGTKKLTHVLGKDCQQCVLPILKLLWKSGVKIDFVTPTIFFGISTKTVFIDDMIIETKYALAYPCCFFLRLIPDDEISDEMVLLKVLKRLRKSAYFISKIYLPESKMS